MRKKIREPRRSTELVEEIDFWKNLDDQPLSVKRQAASPAKMVMCQPRELHLESPEADSPQNSPEWSVGQDDSLDLARSLEHSPIDTTSRQDPSKINSSSPDLFERSDEEDF